MPESPIFPDAILLAAGLGSRLGALVDERPKALVEIGGRPLLDRAIDAFVSEGVTRFAVTVHHRAGQVMAHVDAREDANPRLRFRISNEHDAPLGTGRGVVKALPLVDTDALFIVQLSGLWTDGDDRPVARMIERLARGDVDAVLLTAHPARVLAGGRSHDFCLDPSGRVTLDSGAPVLSTGVALVSRRVFKELPADPFEIEAIFDRALEAGRLGGVALAGAWMAISDPASIEAAEAKLGQA